MAVGVKMVKGNGNFKMVKEIYYHLRMQNGCLDYLCRQSY